MSDRDVDFEMNTKMVEMLWRLFAEDGVEAEYMWDPLVQHGHGCEFIRLKWGKK